MWLNKYPVLISRCNHTGVVPGARASGLGPRPSRIFPPLLGPFHIFWSAGPRNARKPPILGHRPSEIGISALWNRDIWDTAIPTPLHTPRITQNLFWTVLDYNLFFPHLFSFLYSSRILIRVPEILSREFKKEQSNPDRFSNCYFTIQHCGIICFITSCPWGKQIFNILLCVCKVGSPTISISGRNDREPLFGPWLGKNMK